ncbi:permease [Deinococcus radiopugnans]|uniref:Probable membrane transporter protein n=1 Tax=Deinococcus radiopugnans TaxID=57497 RepID=A0A0A7KHI1_9DEIO|nr:TSUP family transporter [Deinococcus radiopugnans]AIZ45606.1 permease [Deinococcus radiopugnans]QLG11335.1 TSUP family transporter [Deinococcus sp. D7000]
MPGPEVLLYGLPLAFLAGFIDAVAGGGGTITLPTLFFMGLSPAQVVATNKLLAIFGSASSTFQYWRKGHLELALLVRLLPLALIGSAFGASLVHFVNPDAFRTLIGVVILGVGALVLVNKRFGLEDHYPGLTARTLALTLPGAFVIGIYDGFLGPGTGTFLMFLFALAGFNLVGASGNARFINLATNLGAFVFFLIGGKMVFWIGLPMGVANALGATLGARMAMLRGSAFVKWMYGGIVLLVSVRLLFGG